MGKKSSEDDFQELCYFGSLCESLFHGCMDVGSLYGVDKPKETSSAVVINLSLSDSSAGGSSSPVIDKQIGVD